MAAKTFWKWYDKELPSGDDASNFQAAWDAAIESVEENGNSLQQLKAEILSLLQQAIGEIDGGKYYDAVPPLELAVAKLSAI